MRTLKEPAGGVEGSPAVQGGAGLEWRKPRRSGAADEARKLEAPPGLEGSQPSVAEAMRAAGETQRPAAEAGLWQERVEEVPGRPARRWEPPPPAARAIADAAGSFVVEGVEVPKAGRNGFQVPSGTLLVPVLEGSSFAKALAQLATADLAGDKAVIPLHGPVDGALLASTYAGHRQTELINVYDPSVRLGYPESGRDDVDEWLVLWTDADKGRTYRLHLSEPRADAAKPAPGPSEALLAKVAEGFKRGAEAELNPSTDAKLTVLGRGDVAPGRARQEALEFGHALVAETNEQIRESRTRAAAGEQRRELHPIVMAAFFSLHDWIRETLASSPDALPALTAGGVGAAPSQAQLVGFVAAMKGSVDGLGLTQGGAFVEHAGTILSGARGLEGRYASEDEAQAAAATVDAIRAKATELALLGP